MLVIAVFFSVGAGAGCVARAQPAPVSAAAAAFRFGDLQIFALRDSKITIPNDGKVFGADVGSARVADVLVSHNAHTDKFCLDIDALLVKSNGHVMLFDTGLGPKEHGALLSSMALVGVYPAEVTDIFITHSHEDHIGGLEAMDGHLAFPNAIIHMSAKEWAWMQSQPDSRVMVTVISSHLRTFDPGGTIEPGVNTVALYGHTPGHVGYELFSGSAKLLDVGDIVHSSIISVAEPDWANGFDYDVKLGEATRRITLTRLAASDEWIFAPHFPFPGIGQIRAQGNSFEWEPGLP